ncbi:MAG: acyl-CoA synthetase FdrA [Alphaproteobacteria bacterium]
MNMGTRIIADMYRDSVALMKISSSVTLLDGVKQASCIMATAANLELLREAGLIHEDPGARPNEVLIAVEAETEAALAAALDAAEAELRADPIVADENGVTSEPLRSIEMALDGNVEANFALIATPGPFAAAEAMKSVQLGLNVMMFSDNVSIDDELALKTQAEQAGLMVMGPDCGTAIIDGAPLGFANVVRRGEIGIVAASGTGLQQVSCLIDADGCGVSQAIGTGGRDLDSRIGGITTKRAITALGADPDTKVIVLISKPPAPDVANDVLEHAVATGKPVIACLLGLLRDKAGKTGVTFADTLEEAAHLAVTAAGANARAPGGLIDATLPGLNDDRRYLRALYSGGTFCYEALTMLGTTLDGVHSNTSSVGIQTLNDPWTSAGHTILDLGDDLFTRGRPHPMIDHRLRNDRIMAEGEDPGTGVILFDIVLGHGAHEDPVAAMAPALSAVPKHDDGGPVLLGFVCGTDSDPQGLARQRDAMVDLGVRLADNNAQAVRTAAAILEGTK